MERRLRLRVVGRVCVSDLLSPSLRSVTPPLPLHTFSCLRVVGRVVRSRCLLQGDCARVVRVRVGVCGWVLEGRLRGWFEGWVVRSWCLLQPGVGVAVSELGV